MRLHLDGAYALNRFMDGSLRALDYGNLERTTDLSDETPSKCVLFARRVWFRLTLPLHFALTIIRTIGGQALRGTSSIVSGVLTLDFHRDGKLVSGLNDYLSLLVEAVVLPLLAIGAIFVPKAIGELLQKGVVRWDVDRNNRDFNGRIYQLRRSYWVPGVQTFFVKIPLMITGIPNIVLRQATLGAQSLLQGRVKQAGENFLGMLQCVASPCWILSKSRGRVALLYNANGMEVGRFL
ncbi:MAG: hypothetical protein KR126chlam2_01307 [Chlamydiae bacterium]|nr:hypothetical protein [Chlamydiota bacterium]